MKNTPCLKDTMKHTDDLQRNRFKPSQVRTRALARVLACAGILLLLFHPTGRADSEMPERILWKKTPIPLRLTLGQERLIHFPASVQVGVPEELYDLLRVQSVDGTVYLLAGGDFDSGRVMTREVDSGRIYLFDVTAGDFDGPNHPLRIFSGEGGHTGAEAGYGYLEAGTGPGFPEYSTIELTRFAAQQLYAPARLLQDLPGLVRVPVTHEPVPLVRGGAIKATPLVAWRSGSRYLTAVKLTNLSNQPRELDPRTLRGQWLTAAFQHGRLHPASVEVSDEADTTAVYLVSTHPFESSL